MKETQATSEAVSREVCAKEGHRLVRDGVNRPNEYGRFCPQCGLMIEEIRGNGAPKDR